VHRNIAGTVSGIGRVIVAGRIQTSSPFARTTCLSGAAGPITTLEDFSVGSTFNFRIDAANNCAGASQFRVQAF
jgi:hypothetical protein